MAAPASASDALGFTTSRFAAANRQTKLFKEPIIRPGVIQGSVFQFFKYRKLAKAKKDFTNEGSLLKYSIPVYSRHLRAGCVRHKTGTPLSPNQLFISRASSVLHSKELRLELCRLLSRAYEQGFDAVEITSGRIHKKVVGRIDGPNHRMPTVCAVMRSIMKTGDIIIHETPGGLSSTIRIRYQLPHE